MWMIDPKLLCRQHLLGEHSEIHKFRHNFVKGHNISGRISPVVQIEPLKMEVRHDDLVEEMKARGYNHKSPYVLPDLSSYGLHQLQVTANLKTNINDLFGRCKHCAKLIRNNK